MSQKKTAAKARKATKAGSTAKKASKGLSASKATAKRAKAKKPKAASLTKRETQKLQQMLLDKRRALIGDMNGISAGALGKNRQESAGDLTNMPTHPADIGTDNYEHEFTLGLLESERTLLGELDEALERIEQGTYGVCLGTGKPIAKPRLRARPWSKYCIDYARMIEKGLVRPGQESEGTQVNNVSEEDQD